MAGILNPPEDAAIAKKLIERVKECISHDDTKLLNQVLERDEYLQVIGGRTRLDRVLKDLERIYQRETHT